jgi:predicted RNA binding protein YcfA (HicA-like mRNA interferase family)
VKCSELYRLLKKNGWVVVSKKGSHVKMKHDQLPGIIIFPDHGSQEIGKGLKKRICKLAEIDS